jgi:hypothetical protein
MLSKWDLLVGIVGAIIVVGLLQLAGLRLF